MDRSPEFVGVQRQPYEFVRDCQLRLDLRLDSRKSPHAEILGSVSPSQVAEDTRFEVATAVIAFP